MLRGEGGLFGLHQAEIHLAAHPGVGRRIALLRFGQLLGFPVGKLLGLRDLEAQDDGGHLLDRLVTDAILPDDLLQVHEVLRLETGEFLQAMDVVMDGGAHLDDGRVGQDGAKPARDAAHLLDAEEVRLFGSGELQQGRSVGALVRRESRPGLGVEPDDFLVLEIADSLPELLSERVDDMDLPGEGRQFQAADLFRTNRYLEHTRVQASFGRKDRRR